MQSASDLKTDLSFLARLRNWQNEAWKEFLTEYRPVMARWAVRYVPSQVDAEEVADRVLLNLVKAIPSFRHDGRERGFRNYLLVAIQHAAWDLLREQGKCPGGQGAGDSAVAALLNEAADSASVVELERELGSAVEIIKVQTAEAVDAVKASLRSPKTWQAFELHVLEGRPAREVAAELGIPQGDVYVYAHRVRERLRQELERRQPQPRGGRRNGQ
jgi:RNA polymerase sigma-70 factor (ECF subfamily)